MAPSLLKTVSAAAVTLAAQASATKCYQVSEIYNSTNFFDKFDFVTGTDPNGGYVQYQSQSSASTLGLTKYQNDEVYIGVDHTTSGLDPDGVGRNSVRLESKNVYNHGLIIANFTHLPTPVCGSWPAFWFFGEPWPTKGEIDIYENWNDLTFNRHTSHVDAPAVVGNCTLESGIMSATIDSPNCYDFATGQSNYQGCSASEYSSTFGSASGGIFAMEWTEDYLKIWDWAHGAAPADIASGEPSPSLLTWGLPSYVIKQCNVDKAFKDMKMVLNIDFCAVAGQTDKWGASCEDKTGYATCAEYVAANEGDFADANFQIKDIRIYQQAEAASTSTLSSASSPALTSASSSSVASTSSFVFSNSTTSSASYATTSSVVSDDGDDDESCDDDEDDEETSSSYVASSTASVSAVTTDSSSSSLATGTSDPSSVQASSSDSTNSYATTASAQELTTSIIYSTSVHTVTSCASTVTNCPANGYVTTEIISIGVTVCPVTAAEATAVPTTTAGIADTTTAAVATPEEYTTSTVKVTKVYTITSCKSTVTNCPAGSVTTEVSETTTVYPVSSATSGASSGSSPSSGSGSDSTSGSGSGSNSSSNSVSSSSSSGSTSTLTPSSGSSGEESSSSSQLSESTGTVSNPTESTGVASTPEAETTVTSATDVAYLTATNTVANPSTTGGSSSGSTVNNNSTGIYSNSSSSASEVNVIVTATVVPITSANTGYNATLTKSYSASTGATTVTTSAGAATSSSVVVEVSGAVKEGASFALAVVVAFFVFAM
ncbi:glycoside hydrolase family 16 protein [Hypoxylon sp. CI-4A]|nr:glycoside hydrolase family 16 protein [Hypoxylon sp. CI-4A]